MHDSPDQTLALLERWHQGDRAALDLLVDQEAGWVHQQVRRRLGKKLRKKIESIDLVQEAMIEILTYSPPFLLADRERFRALMARIVENVICDHHGLYKARRRAMSREEQEGSVLSLDGMHRSQTMPEQAAGRREEEDWLRLGLELLDPEDREIILLRQWDELAFPEIANRLDISESGARMRFQRALPKLAEKVNGLRSGAYLDQLLPEAGE